MSDKSDAQNIVFTKNTDTFILFVNPNEKSDSKLFYDLLLADQRKKLSSKQHSRMKVYLASWQLLKVKLKK